ncbi:MAG: hypothetical protein OXE76_06145 [Alphaproteobacteria bacterium]|nr:hypothetical protein [Alphaproteobacteria bacterium]
MGNDAKAATRVWGKRLGELNAAGNLQGSGHHLQVNGLEPNAHYVVVLYSLYEGNLNPWRMHCFRTARDPSNPWGGSATRCFAPYTPTVGGTLQSANYAACVQARNACNAASNTTWEQAGNSCIPASN